jgi:DNA primase
VGQYLDFKAIAESVDVEQVAKHIGLMLKRSQKELRACCPACNTDDERSLALYPETNSFRCFAASLSGDSISLYAHLTGTGNYAAAKALQEQFGAASAARTAPATAPQKTERGTAKAQPASKNVERAFDPLAYLAKLTYTDEVAELGITELDASRLGIGFASTGLLRGRVAFPIRNEDGTIAGFIGVNGTDVKVPQSWIKSNVVKLKRA